MQGLSQIQPFKAEHKSGYKGKMKDYEKNEKGKPLIKLWEKLH